MTQRFFKDSKQLSLFPEAIKMYSDDELIATITDKPCDFSAKWMSDYRMEQVYSKLSPKSRRIAQVAVELYKRSLEKKANALTVSNSRIADEIMRPKLLGNAVEEFWIMALNKAMKVIGIRRISVGGLDFTATDIRIICKELLNLDATCCMIFHNHPSGNLQPSSQDKQLTRRINEATKLLEIRLIDHLIITDNGYYSFSDEGNL